MLSPQALIRGIVQRGWTITNPDTPNNDVALRLETTGAAYTQPLVRKTHALADEGTYFIINNGQTGITPPLGVAYSATVAALTLYNNDALGRRMYLDYISLSNIVAVTATSGTAGAPCNAALVVDNGSRYTSGGTALPAPVSPNLVNSAAIPNIAAYFGNITASAATGNARTLVGQRVFRPEATASAMTVVGDMFLFNFGGVEASLGSSLTITNPCIVPVPMPPVIVGPQQSAVLYLWWPNSTPAGGASGFLPEIGFWMR
jgi:hypothetical protein